MINFFGPLVKGSQCAPRSGTVETVPYIRLSDNGRRDRVSTLPSPAVTPPLIGEANALRNGTVS